PFNVLGGDTQTTALADGLTEVLAAQLSQLSPHHGLQVIPASETRREKMSSAAEARRQFGVNLVVGGSLQRAGTMLRIAPVLIDATNDRELATVTIDVTAGD